MKYKINDVVEMRGFGKGKIIDIISSETRPILVEFTNFNPDLHSGGERGSIIGKSHRCWWCNERELKLVEKRPVKCFGIVEFCKNNYK